MSHQVTVKRTLIVCAGAFAFCFAMIPFYSIWCEWTGANGRGVEVASPAAVSAPRIDTSRTVEVQFDSHVNSMLPWSFAPMQSSIRVHPGQTVIASYRARNDSDRPIVGQASYSVAPNRASLYFVKTECFCFTEQLLQSGESKEMPIRFEVSPDLPSDVHVLTLSYTFFKKSDGAVALR